MFFFIFACSDISISKFPQVHDAVAFLIVPSLSVSSNGQSLLQGRSAVARSACLDTYVCVLYLGVNAWSDKTILRDAPFVRNSSKKDCRLLKAMQIESQIAPNAYLSLMGDTLSRFSTIRVFRRDSVAHRTFWKGGYQICASEYCDESEELAIHAYSKLMLNCQEPK